VRSITFKGSIKSAFDDLKVINVHDDNYGVSGQVARGMNTLSFRAKDIFSRA
jgi:hypothetical protein